jgi:hypothetical protein
VTDRWPSARLKKSPKKRYFAQGKMKAIKKKGYWGGAGSGISAEEWTFSR